MKQMVVEWRQTEDKNKVTRQIEALLFRKNEKKVAGKMQKKIESKFKETGEEIKPGAQVIMKKNHQVGQVLELRGKRAVVKIGLLPMQVDIKDLVVVTEKNT